LQELSGGTRNDGKSYSFALKDDFTLGVLDRPALRLLAMQEDKLLAQACAVIAGLFSSRDFQRIG